VNEWYLLTNTDPSLVSTSLAALSYYYRWNIDNVFQTDEECRVGNGTLATTNRFCNNDTFIGCFHGVDGRLEIVTMNHSQSN
jgi:hypothetical protein